MILAAAILFLATVAVAAWWCFPETASRLRLRLPSLLRRERLSHRGGGGSPRALWWGAAALLLIAPPLLILHGRQKPRLAMYAQADIDRGRSQVLALLEGEQLVPPPELPPEIFVAAEATLLQLGDAAAAPENIVAADRRWERIDPQLQRRVLAVYQVMHDQYGYRMALVEGYRSAERQAELAREGKATRAGAGRSCHQYGLAVDSALLRDGRLQWDMRDPWVREGYYLYGRLAQEAGLEWGGSWRSLKDYVHVEARDACRAAIRQARG